MSVNSNSEEVDKKIIEKRKNEILGILLITLGLFSGLSLFTGTTGMIGEILSNFYLNITGIGSYLFPLLFIVWGIALIRFKQLEFNSRLIGFLLTYMMILAIIHTYYYPLSSFNQVLDNQTGGIIGGSISWIFTQLFGITGAYIVAGAFLLIGILLWFDVLLHSLIKNIFSKIYNLVSSFFQGLYTYFNKLKNKIKKSSDNQDDYSLENMEALEANHQKEDNEIEEYYFNNNDSNEDTSNNTEPIIDINQNETIEEKNQKQQQSKSKKNNDKSKSKDNVGDVYRLPPMNLLKSSGNKKVKLNNKSELLENTLSSFGVEARVKEVSYGPKITRYEVQPDTGVKVSKIVNLADDIALALAAPDVRIEAPIPGKAAVGIEVPHNGNIFVRSRDILSSKQFQKAKSKLTLALGKGIDGKPLVADLSSMPHLLVAGATGSGKSVCINSFITSLLYKATPEELKLILVDPKKVELSNYKGLPHLFTPVVTDPKKASNVLKLVVEEMENRYEKFSETKTKGIESYNNKVSKEDRLPYIVVIIDELSDLMMVAANEVEDNICRLAQMSRAAGIHLIIATQRPSVDVITGLIKANIPSRISFAVSSQTDSRTILDMGGAEKLLGNGDMLYFPVDKQKPQRIQGAFISNEEVNNVVHYVKNQTEPDYEVELDDINEIKISSDKDKDELYDEAVELVVKYRASISMLQRKLHVGHSRAARMIDTMEEEGIVGPYAGSKPREVLITEEELPEYIDDLEKESDKKEEPDQDKEKEESNNKNSKSESTVKEMSD
ncbi:MAG: DNA translocase FtsK 4TM domain-containing protein [Halanaerobiaceae bacterium]